MSLIVQKFGGSSVANAQRVFNVANIITDTYDKGNDVIVVVSAQGDTTDDLIAKARKLTPTLPKGKWICFFPQENKFPLQLLAMAIENWDILLFLLQVPKRVL